MSYEPFFERFHDLALKETRRATLLPGNEFNLPPDEYGLLEAYCNDEDCDFRRVFFNVISRKQNKILAVITYGWESDPSYVRRIIRHYRIFKQSTDPKHFRKKTERVQPAAKAKRDPSRRSSR